LLSTASTEFARHGKIFTRKFTKGLKNVNVNNQRLLSVYNKRVYLRLLLF